MAGTCHTKILRLSLSMKTAIFAIFFASALGSRFHVVEASNGAQAIALKSAEVFDDGGHA